MKKLVTLMLGTVSMVFMTGCCGPTSLGWDLGATPAYSSCERYTMIGRNWELEGKMAVDDIDHALLLRPVSHMSIWHVR